MLKRTTYLILLLAFIGIGCKSNYEKVRSSNDPVAILKAADTYFDNEDYIKAQGLYELVIPFYRGKKEAEDLFYNYTYTYYNTDQYVLASHYFDNFTKTFYNSPKKEEMAFMSAYSNYLLSPNSKLDQTPSTKAIEALQFFINTYPGSTRIEECNALMDELRAKLEQKSFDQGKLYYDLKNYQSAMSSLENTLKDFPETKRAEEIKYLIVKSSGLLAKNSIYEKMQDRLESTIVKGNKFTSKYPDSSYNKELNDKARDIHQLIEETGNIYEALAIMSSRAKQLAVDIKAELHGKLEEFAVNSETIEEIQENKEQIEISKFYEKLPNAAVISMNEFLDNGLEYRYRDQNEDKDA